MSTLRLSLYWTPQPASATGLGVASHGASGLEMAKSRRCGRTGKGTRSPTVAFRSLTTGNSDCRRRKAQLRLTSQETSIVAARSEVDRAGGRMDARKGKGVRARFFDGAIPRIMEGVAIGLVVAAALLAKDYLAGHWDRQDEIAYIRDVIMSARLDISKAQAGPVAILTPGNPSPTRIHRSRADAQLKAWRIFTAELSDVLAYRTSRLTYEEKRELREHFPGISVDGRSLMGDRLDIIIRAGVRMHYKDLFSQAEGISWLGLPPASQEVADGLVPADRREAGG